MPWMSLDDEHDLYDQLVATGRAAVQIIGSSVQGRPIHLVRMGDPPPPADQQAALLLVGCVHGHEPAGREAMLQYAEHLSTTQDSAELDFLANVGLWMIPTLNPDGRHDNLRRNANDVDLNRDH